MLASAPLAALVACASSRVPPAHTSAPTAEDLRWEQRAQRVTIVRDDWGIAHVHGRTDADAVFGMSYAQAEDDFARIETNYLTALGRLAEAEGEAALWQDLRARLFVDPETLQRHYADSPAWLHALMDAWADGLNYYLASNPVVKPRVLMRFEPWMALAFSEGSIGGDIERVELEPLAAFYASAGGSSSSAAVQRARHDDDEPTGSNGFAIAPRNTTAGRALLLINPHTSFYFRSELQMTSDEGLDAYGAVTWGQFFVYQGFNARVGWMHTSSGADSVDEYAEAIVGAARPGEPPRYRYGHEQRALVVRPITIAVRTETGIDRRSFTTYRSHHGPIVRADGDKWIAARLMEKPIEALSQSFARTKARDLAAFRETMELHADSTNNTIYADADGHIAYFHPQFVPRRDDRFDWTRPVDGSDPATEWTGVHDVEDSPYVLDPPGGWVMNTNNWPYTAAGTASPKRDRFPRYMDSAGENPRGLQAVRVLAGRTGFTLAALRDAAFDRRLIAFETLIPQLLAAYGALPPADPARGRLAEPIATLRAWDFRWSADSIATTLAVSWGDELWDEAAAAARRGSKSPWDILAADVAPARRIAALGAAVDRLSTDFGSWRIPWGELNRYQRIETRGRAPAFDDEAASIAVPFTSARWGSLASYGARTYPGTKRRYGTSGNSFVAVVEFGPQVRARAVTTGGASGNPGSPHYLDQAQRYVAGDLRDVYFDPADLAKHTVVRYRPGPTPIEPRAAP